jgi:hypothetical protein
METQTKTPEPTNETNAAVIAAPINIDMEQQTKPPEQPTPTQTTATAPPTLAAVKSVAAPPAVYNQNTANAVVPVDKVCHESADGQFQVKQLVKTAQRYPQSKYPCVVLSVKPVEHTRVRQLPGGYVELMPTHPEVDAVVDAMNEAAMAAGKGKLYEVLQRVPPKPGARKEAWKRRNEERVAAKQSSRKKPRWLWIKQMHKRCFN